MAVSQFMNSIWQILANRHINRCRGIVRHLQWQFRKAFNLFPVELALSDSRIVATHRRCGVSALVNSQGLYDFNNMSLVKFLLEKGGTFFDVGANIGSYSLVASEQAPALVVAFEPHPATFGLLADNISLNHRNNTMLVHAAVGESDGYCLLSNESCSALNKVVSREMQSAVSVPCRRLDSFCRSTGIIPDFIKIDTEGYELSVLRSLGDYLARVKIILLEMPAPKSVEAERIISYLTGWGFQGPYYCDFANRNLSRKPFSREDPLFIAWDEMERMKSSAFRFVE
jgi:FkbM family methyltransferase